MTEKNERPKPPRRPGRALNATKTTASTPPPPPSAELTPEQFAAEQATAQRESSAAPRSAPSVVPDEGTMQARTATVPEVSEASIPPGAGAVPGEPAQEVAASAFAAPAAAAPEGGMEFVSESVEQSTAPVQPAGSADPTSQPGPSHITSWALGTAPAAELAVRTAHPAPAAGTAFPMRADNPAGRQEEEARTQEPSQGAPYAHGSGRPKDIPDAAVVLNQRMIRRESLDSSVPAALRLKKRIKRFALDNGFDHLPIGDIVAVALDEWLTARGF
ncbi:hypothetical protein ACFY5F_36610 [Streptomyces sp. NPDC013161]|uniref:hypothetical protein n=1 Tax=Streptomyces sp. NPDC013161 TaxID=3364862 RepID=UPI0036BC551B